jgi:hypothetical protein
MSDCVGGVMASARLNSNNYRIDQPLARIDRLLGRWFQLDAHRGRARVIGSAVMESQVFP